MKHRKSGALVAVLLLAMLGGCGHDAQVQALEKRVQVLETQVAELDAKAKALQSDVLEISSNDFLRQFEGVAYLTPGGDGYSVVRSDLGALTVSLDNIQPYASGSKVTLRFGNLTSGTINGLKATLEWGRINKKGLPENEAAKSREVKFNESMRSGSWTRSDVVLEGVPPTDLGFVRVREVGHTGVSLLTR
jgi:outer membrane murein-binding lipoprotein Lpp